MFTQARLVVSNRFTDISRIALATLVFVHDTSLQVSDCGILSLKLKKLLRRFEDLNTTRILKNGRNFDTVLIKLLLNAKDVFLCILGNKLQHVAGERKEIQI